MTQLDDKILSDLSRCIKMVLLAPPEKTLAELAKRAGLSPLSDFVGLDLSGYKLHDQDLTNFNFSGCDLRGTGIRRDSLREWPKVTGARLDENALKSLRRELAVDSQQARVTAAIEDKRVSPKEREHQLRSYFKLVKGSGRSRSEKALSFLASHGMEAPPFWDENFYDLLHDCSRWQQAENYCARFHDNRFSNLWASIKYAHILGVHRGKIELAQEILTIASKMHPREINIPYNMAEIYGCTDGSERRGLEMYESLLQNKNLDKTHRSQVRLSMIKLVIRKKLGDEIALGYLEGVKFDLLDDDALNAAAWCMYVLNHNLPKALGLAEKAFRNDRTSLEKMHTYFCILIRMGDWKRALPLFDEWTASIFASELVEKWRNYVPPIADAIRRGHGLDLLVMTSQVAKEHRPWHSIRAAIELVITKTSPSDARKNDEEIFILSQQITQYMAKNAATETINWPGYDHIESHH